MRLIASIVATLVVASSVPALAAGCGENRAACEAICTPARVARYYAGVAVRCSTSCGPRFQQCLRTGLWVHLEDRPDGWVERVDGF